MAKNQYGLGKGLGALLGGEDLSELRKPVGYINKAVVTAQPNPQDTADVLRIPVDLIEPNPYQPRVNFATEAMQELADSIRTFGRIGFGYQGLQMEMDMNFPRPEFYNKMFEKWGLATGELRTHR